MARPTLVLCTLLAIGCGGSVSPSTSDAGVGADTSTAGDSASPTDTGVPTPFEVGRGPLDFCKEAGNRASICGDGFDPTKCKQELGCYQTIVRPGDADELLRCFVTRDCGVSQDKCVAGVASKHTSEPAVSEYVATCTKRRTDCTGAFADDYCGFDYGLFGDDFRVKMRSCLEQPCAAISECFRTITTAAGCR
ncbi:MAG: hypothetical protein ABI175_08190 [Polyangiales bacterium]